MDTRSGRKTSMDRLRERADSLRELDLDEIGQGLNGSGKNSDYVEISDNKEEDDIAIAEAIADIEHIDED